MMKSIFSVSILLMSQIAFAHSHINCSSQSGNSCWFANNNSQYSANISCMDSYKTEFKTQLNTNGNYSYQFCDGWGDGLGYPEPGIATECVVQYQNSKIINFRFSSIDWGNKVEFFINESNVSVRLTQAWYSQNPKTVTYVFN